MSKEMSAVRKELKVIKNRNKRVEVDKAWETSLFRMGVISIMTYILATLFLVLISAPNPYLAAFVPVIGFILSTLTFPSIKKRWVETKLKK